MNFADQIALIDSAAGNPKRLALAVLDIVLATEPAELRRAFEAAAVLRWFDERSLYAVLDSDLRDGVAHWLEKLKRLSAVERASGRDGWNVHETTRCGLREQLQTERPQRIAELARRATSAFQGTTVADRIEHAYHLALADPIGCGPTLRLLDFDLQAAPDHALAFTATLAEYLTHDTWPAATRGWAAYFSASNRRHYRPHQATLQDAETALACFESCDLGEGIACAATQLADTLSERGQPGDAAQVLGHYQRSLTVRERLLAASPESAQAARDVSVSLGQFGEFLARRGFPGDAERALGYYQRCHDVLERLLAANPESARAARDVSVSLERLADFLARRGLPGDAEQALGHFQRCLTVRERLLAANPESAQAARDVSVSLGKLADFLASRGLPGDATQALGHYQRSLTVRERLLAANPESAQATRDVSVSLNGLADFLARRGLPGDAEQALGHFQRCNDMFERLLAANPESAEAARDVAVSLIKLADFQARRGLPGDAEQALGDFQRCHDVLERLLAANPDSAEAARDVSVSLNGLADFLARRGLPGDAEQALGYYQRCHDVLERLLAANPESAQAARDVSVSLNRLAYFLARRGLPGDAEQALGHYQRSLTVREGLLAANPDSARAARDLVISIEQLAGMRAQQGDVAGALIEHERALDMARRLWENAESWENGRTLAVSTLLTGQHAAAAGDKSKAGQCYAECFAILDAFARAGTPLDAQMRQLHAELRPIMSGQQSRTAPDQA
jgi:tetratricopeptide (TPR) repeat protein